MTNKQFWTFYTRATEQEKAFMRSGVSPEDILYIRAKALG